MCDKCCTCCDSSDSESERLTKKTDAPRPPNDCVLLYYKHFPNTPIFTPACNCGCINISTCNSFDEYVKSNWFQGIRSDYVLSLYEDPMTKNDTVFCVHYIDDLKLVYDLTHDEEVILNKNQTNYRSNIKITELSDSEFSVFCFVVHELNPEYIRFKNEAIKPPKRFQSTNPNRIAIYLYLFQEVRERYLVENETDVHDIILTDSFKKNIEFLLQNLNSKIISVDNDASAYLLWNISDSFSGGFSYYLKTDKQATAFRPPDYGGDTQWINLRTNLIIPSMSLDQVRGKSYDELVIEQRKVNDEKVKNSKSDSRWFRNGLVGGVVTVKDTPEHIAAAKNIDNARPSLKIDDLTTHEYKNLLNLLQYSKTRTIECVRYSTGEKFTIEFNPAPIVGSLNLN